MRKRAIRMSLARKRLVSHGAHSFRGTEARSNLHKRADHRGEGAGRSGSAGGETPGPRPRPLDYASGRMMYGTNFHPERTCRRRCERGLTGEATAGLARSGAFITRGRANSAGRSARADCSFARACNDRVMAINRGPGLKDVGDKDRR